jgi:predicted nucleic acid-binding protein
MTVQLVFNGTVIFSENNNMVLSFINRLSGIIILLVPFWIDEGIFFNKTLSSNLPSVQDITTFTFSEIIGNMNNIKEIINKTGKKLSKEKLDELLQDIPRHNSFRYINKGSLTDEYFDTAYQTLNDLNIYIIVSNTGSPASEIISLFTKKIYNHASISFDKELKTIISYNGGERIYPPGMNMEMVEYFNKKPDSSIIVYSLPITSEKKRTIIDKIELINKEGNAYNLLGLVFKFSFKPNIMYCSQFVYKILKETNIHYFDKKNDNIKPTDLIELDYHRKLKYEYEVKFNGV